MTSAAVWEGDPRSRSADRCICRSRQSMHEVKKRLRLTNEESHVGQELQGARSHSRCLGWSNDRTCWELSVEEWAWLRHDQVCLEVLAPKRSGIKIRESQAIRRIRQGGH